MSLFELLEDPLKGQPRLDTAHRQAISLEVIDAINREFPASRLEHPGEEEHRLVRERIQFLVGQGLMRRALVIPASASQELAADLARRLLGLGFLDLLLPPQRDDLSEIAVYSSGLVQVMKKGQVRWETVDLAPSAEEISRILDRLLGPQNRSLNESNPTVNARFPRTLAIPGGGRIKALHPVITPPGCNAAFNLRLFEQKPVLPEWLLARGLMNDTMMQELAAAVQAGNRLLISGGTRTGKTTLLSALCNFLPPAWRILKIEDPEEIWIDRPTVQTIEARPQASGTEVRPYTLADGVDDAMRLSPDYLVIGEVRDGRAAQALFRALMTGHGGACTFHADSPSEAVARLAVLLGADAGVQKSDALPMIADAVDLLVQLGIRREMRRVTAISRVVGVHPDNSVQMEPLWVWEEDDSALEPRWIRRSPEVH